MRVLAWSIGALVLLTIAGGVYLGVLIPIEVEKEEAGPWHLVYVLSNTRELDHLQSLTSELGEKLQAAGYERREPAKVFFPAGCTNEPEDLSPCQTATSQIGFVTEHAVAVSALGALEYSRTIPPSKYLVARFPYRGALSYVIGNWRVEAALEEQRVARKYSKSSTMVIERGDHILYLQPAEPVRTGHL